MTKPVTDSLAQTRDNVPMSHASRWIKAAGLCLLVPATLMLLAACAGEGTPLATPSPSVTPGADATTGPPGPTATVSPGHAPPLTGPALSRVTVTRSGGIAGVNQSVRIEADGSWVYTDKRRGTSQSGRLDNAQRQRLASLVTGAALANEARLSPAGVCNDGFVYAIQVGDMTARLDDCGSTGRQPTLAAVVDLLVDATAL